LFFGLLARFSLLPALPNLSDDYFRFLYDGILFLKGFNPFGLIPKESLKLINSPYAARLVTDMNSPNYYTVYPPVIQYLNLIAAWIIAQTKSIGFAIAFYKIIIIGSDCLSYFFIKALSAQLKPGFGTKNALFYFLNPLIIIEFTGNIHFESLMVCGVLGFIYFVSANRSLYASCFLSLAIWVKLIPIVLFLFLMIRSDIRNSLKVTGIFLLISIGLWYPFLEGFNIEGVKESLLLYFKVFEFNGSIFNLFKAVGIWLYGYDPIRTIGPILSLFSVLILFGMLWKSAKKVHELEAYGLFFLWYFFHLLLSPIIHPWYVASLTPIILFLDKKVILAWTYTGFFSYIAYSQQPIGVPWLVLLIEYGIMLFFLVKVIGESRLRRNKIKVDK
jgi:hypothetical protein